MNEKMLVIGGSKGIGKSIVDCFSADSVSRTTGFDITDKIDRSRIARMSLNYDVVVNHAYTKENHQLLMLESLVDEWIKNEKLGVIINTGSIATYRDIFKDKADWWTYVSNKSSVDAYCKSVAKRCQENKFKFRITNIKPGMLDTEKSRSKSHFTTGINGDNYCQLIQFIVSMPNNICIPEVVIESKE
jgi:NAD(P)-dependent dehydrogenase (short-subunit alcohol dehydrogenase family)